MEFFAYASYIISVLSLLAFPDLLPSFFEHTDSDSRVDISVLTLALNLKLEGSHDVGRIYHINKTCVPLYYFKDVTLGWSPFQWSH